mmetsp:Transcript_26489/g.45091  ORF Transcript_26489/g.45091 Transcript_26489/m.45091 type:complete len:248 (+) Transcript_26489:1366-2109(+)
MQVRQLQCTLVHRTHLTNPILIRRWGLGQEPSATFSFCLIHRWIIQNILVKFFSLTKCGQEHSEFTLYLTSGTILCNPFTQWNIKCFQVNTLLIFKIIIVYVIIIHTIIVTTSITTITPTCTTRPSKHGTTSHPLLLLFQIFLHGIQRTIKSTCTTTHHGTQITFLIPCLQYCLSRIAFISIHIVIISIVNIFCTIGIKCSNWLIILHGIFHKVFSIFFFLLIGITTSSASTTTTVTATATTVTISK